LNEPNTDQVVGYRTATATGWGSSLSSTYEGTKAQVAEYVLRRYVDVFGKEPTLVTVSDPYRIRVP
jgi:hypothetical protein